MNRLGIKQKEFEGFQLQRAIIGPIATNVFFLINTDTKEILLVDPAEEAPRLIQYIKGQGFSLKGILLTHGHEDHILAAKDLKEAFDCPILAHEEEAALLAEPKMNCSLMVGEPFSLIPDRLVREGEKITLAGLSFKVLHTPGHTAGSCCYYFPAYELLISGDTLFHGSYGRTDLPTGNDAQMLASIRRLLTELPEETLVWPGHMDRTYIAFEKRYNPLAELI